MIPPKFITLEGGEGAGKTTLLKVLKEALEAEGYSVCVTREPGGCHLAEDVRALLLNTKTKLSDASELLLFLAARAQHMAELIKPSLDQGKWVLCDRFTDSTLAYQGIARGLGLEEIKPLCHFASLQKEPDLTFLLDLPPEEGHKRVCARAHEQDRLEQEGFDFHTKVREGFLHLQQQNPERIHLLDATKSREEVASQALKVLKEKKQWIT